MSTFFEQKEKFAVCSTEGNIAIVLCEESNIDWLHKKILIKLISLNELDLFWSIYPIVKDKKINFDDNRTKVNKEIEQDDLDNLLKLFLSKEHIGSLDSMAIEYLITIGQTKRAWSFFIDLLKKKY